MNLDDRLVAVRKLALWPPTCSTTTSAYKIKLVSVLSVCSTKIPKIPCGQILILTAFLLAWPWHKFDVSIAHIGLCEAREWHNFHSDVKNLRHPAFVFCFLLASLGWRPRWMPECFRSQKMCILAQLRPRYTNYCLSIRFGESHIPWAPWSTTGGCHAADFSCQIHDFYWSWCVIAYGGNGGGYTILTFFYGSGQDTKTAHYNNCGCLYFTEYCSSNNAVVLWSSRSHWCQWKVASDNVVRWWFYPVPRPAGLIGNTRPSLHPPLAILT